MIQYNNSKVGDRVVANGHPGTVVRTKDSPGSAWMDGLVEVRLAAGLVCVSDCAPEVIPVGQTENR